MQHAAHHVASHELAQLERFVGDCVAQLPRLPTAAPHALPPRCSSYHAACSAMLREVLAVLAPLSPRLCHLVAQVWDLTSINFFVLLQLAQSSLDAKDVLHAQLRQLQSFSAETARQHALRAASYESELDKMRVDARELRAELQKTRQKANRLGVENAQLRKAVHGLMEMNDSLHGRAAAVDTLDDTGGGGGAPLGDAEERDLYGVSSEELERLDVVHPIESFAQDFDQLFDGLVDRARAQMALLNELDRFMNSNVVSLLWRHGPDEDQTKFLQQMMSKRTIGTQSEDEELGILHDDGGDDDGDGAGDGDAEHAGGGDGDGDTGDNNQRASGATGTATLVTKRQLLPAALRAQLTTRPKIQRVMDKEQLSRVVLLLLVDKMESDGAALRLRQPRAPLHRFMKEFFLARYEIAPLAEYRMMEVVKSVLYYHEKLEADARRLQHLTGSDRAAAVEATTASADGGWAFSLLPGVDAASLSCDDLRLALFARLCELVPLQWGSERAQVAPAAGNLFACAANALLDFLGDAIELDRATHSLRDVVERRAAADWELSLDVAWALVGHHFAHSGRARLALLQSRLSALAAAPSSLSLVPVDALLVFVATQWFELDQRLTAKLHDTFHREVAAQQHRDFEARGFREPPPPMDTLQRVWLALPDEHLSPLELDDLERAFATILETRQSQQRRVSKRQSFVAATGVGSSSSSRPGSAVASASGVVSQALGLCVGGVSEKEFVFHTQQILRVRRGCRGLRTHGKCVVDPQTAQVLGARGRVLERAPEQPVARDELKP